jgi:hypothetical protein
MAGANETSSKALIIFVPLLIENGVQKLSAVYNKSRKESKFHARV